MPETRSAGRRQKRKRGVPEPVTIDSDPDSEQSTVDAEIIQSPPALQHDSRTRKKPRPDPQHALPPTINSRSANGSDREDTPVDPTQLEQGDWLGLTDQILEELKEKFGPLGGDLGSATKTFLCEVLAAILLRLYRAYSLEKLFGQGNSGPKGAVKDAIGEDNLEMSFQAVAAFADRYGYRPIETVRGNRAPSTQSGTQFFDWIWGDRPHSMSRKRWDTAPFRQQYHRIRHELDMPGSARDMRQELEHILAYRFFQSQTVFSYPNPTHGTLGSTSKSDTGKIASRVWYHQTRLTNEAISKREVEGVKRCNDNPIEFKERWTPKRLPESVQSWELVISQCRQHQLYFTTQ